MPHSHAHFEDADDLDVWSVEGRFLHLIYSPKGAIEGVLIDTDGIATQFVTDPHEASILEQFASLREGQHLVIEGTDAGPSPKGESDHMVYDFERLVSIDGAAPASPVTSTQATGTIVRLNYAKHGAPNGVVLDNGDFIHTKPDGMKRLGLKVGARIRAEGDARPLAVGNGRVIEARSINGKPVGPAH